MMAPILGPTIGGYLTEIYSWRWVFYVNLPVGILSTIGIAMFLSESKRDANVRFDAFGFMMLGTALGARCNCCSTEARRWTGSRQMRS